LTIQACEHSMMCRSRWHAVQSPRLSGRTALEVCCQPRHRLRRVRSSVRASARPDRQPDGDSQGAGALARGTSCYHRYSSGRCARMSCSRCTPPSRSGWSCTAGTRVSRIEVGKHFHPRRAALIQRAPSTSFFSNRLTCMIFYLKAGITSSVRSFKLRCTASGGSNPPGLSSAVNPVRPSISLYWVKRSMTRAGLPKMTLVSRISS
jgi:hypothetical protein